MKSNHTKVLPKILKPRQAINKAFLKIKPNRGEIEKFKTHLIQLLGRIDNAESEEFHKNLISDFLNETYYKSNHYINTKGRNDLVIHNGNTAKSTVGVIIEVKKPTNKSEMLTTTKINVKAFQELVLYYLRERITHNNLEVKYLIATNINEWFIFDSNVFEKQFAEYKELVRNFDDFENGRLSGKTTDFFYNDIAKPFIDNIEQEIEFTYFDIQKYEEPLHNNNPEDDNKLISLFKLLSPEHLLKLPFANDSNSLDKRFYGELLHIIGLSETKDGGKKLIERNKGRQRNTGSFLENAINQLDSLDKISRLNNPNNFGTTQEQRLFNVGLELSITWINRILFLKLLEAQLKTYHKGDKSYEFLSIDKVKNYDDLNNLFFQVLAKQQPTRDEDVKEIFAKVPYLNSSLFEPTDIEHDMFAISGLDNNKTIPLYSATVLKNENGRKRTGNLSALKYLFEFLNAYDFSSEGSEAIQEDNKTLINASVLGLIFEKINGYKDGSFFTPGFITMYMCRETIRKAVIQKFNDTKKWHCTDIDALYNKIDREKIQEANNIINSLKICDPAVGSGHFLVSALNEMIAIKNDLNILQDRKGRRLKEYQFEVVSDELIVTDEDGELFEYNPTNKESERVQKTLFHEKQTIIENCLFGVDINQNSVKICRLRLWIELLKNAYYKNKHELETLPNIDINIKCGNSLISRFKLDADLKKALKNSKLTIDDYKKAGGTYHNAQDKEQKRAMEKLIDDIKNDFRSEIVSNDPKIIKLRKLQNERFVMTNQVQAFEPSKKEKIEWNKKLTKLTDESKKLETEIEEIKNNKIYENAFEWRFEFPEVLDDDGEFIGFDVVIGNPPYVQLSKTKDLLTEEKSYLLNRYKTSGGRLNTFIFFTHLSSDILKYNGFLNYIIPNTILSQEYYSFTRNFLANEVTLNEIVGFPILPFEDAVVETVLIHYKKTKAKNYIISIKELTHNSILNVSSIKTETINRDKKYSFVYTLNPIIEKAYEKEHFSFGEICYINQGIALKGDKSISLKDTNNQDKYYKLLDGRNIKKYKLDWDGVYLDYDLDRIHSCKRKDIFESKDKLLFRRVSSSLVFTYDDSQYFALNTLIVVNKIDSNLGQNIKFILGLMNSKLMNYIYKNKFKSTKKVFSEIQARSVKELPVIKTSIENESLMVALTDKIIKSKKQNPQVDTCELENEIDKLVYELYGLTEEEIKIIEKSTT